MRPPMHACNQPVTIQPATSHEVYNMEDWSILDRDYSSYDYYPNYQEKEQNAPAQCVQEPYRSPSPTTLLFATPTCHQPPKGDDPRELRNKAEKQRRDKINQSISRLASIVPTAQASRKLNKISVLRLAAHYLRSHQHVFDSSNREPDFSLKFAETLLKNLKGFLITITYKGIVVVASPNVREYLGYSEFELLGQNVLNIIHKEDHQLLIEQLYPKSCTITKRGNLLIPKEIDAVEKIADALASERRNFVIRFRKYNPQKSEPPQYISCHVEGSFRKADHAGSRGEQVVHRGRRAKTRVANFSTSGNDIVFVGMVRPSAETFVNESVLESFKMEYRTRHSIDGEIIQCEQRISLVTGYMTHEVNGVNAMNFMHRDDVRWVVTALREMYDQHRLVGESCYRLMTKNGQFIYMRTLGWLDVDQKSKAVTSFVCTNTVVAEQEGKQLIKLMKKKFTLMIDNNEEPKEEEEELSEPENEKQTPPLEDPKQLEKVILHLVTDLPSPRTDDRFNQEPLGNGGTSSHLAIIPPKKEKIHEAIEKSYSIIPTCCTTMGRSKIKAKKNKRGSRPNQNVVSVQSISNLITYKIAEDFSVPRTFSQQNTATTNTTVDTVTSISNMGLAPLSQPATSTPIPVRDISPFRDDWNNIFLEPTYNDTYLNNASNDVFDLSNSLYPFPSEPLFDALNGINVIDNPCALPLSYQHAISRPPTPQRSSVSLVPVPSTSKRIRKNTCYSRSARTSGIKNTWKKKNVNSVPQLPQEIETVINQELSLRQDEPPPHNILEDGVLERILDSVEQADGISSRNFIEQFHSLQDSGIFFEDAKETKYKDPYEFREDLSDSE